MPTDENGMEPGMDQGGGPEASFRSLDTRRRIHPLSLQWTPYYALMVRPGVLDPYNLANRKWYHSRSLEKRVIG